MQKQPQQCYFVPPGNIVRQIWGKADSILFIFAGAAAEFALNKAVDWLYFTGKLPADPLGRLFSTVAYAKQIIFAEEEQAHAAIDKITAIHAAVENSRGAVIPDWAYRDVLFMLIFFSIDSYELLYRKLSGAEKEALYDVFFRVGSRMKLQNLPDNFNDALIMHQHQLQSDYEKTKYSIDLYQQYKKHLGPIRYRLLIGAQKLVITPHIRQLCGFSNINWLRPVVPVYKLGRKLHLGMAIQSLLIPRAYIKQVRALDRHE